MALRADSHVIGDAASGWFGVDRGFCIHAEGGAGYDDRLRLCSTPGRQRLPLHVHARARKEG